MRKVTTTLGPTAMVYKTCVLSKFTKGVWKVRAIGRSVVVVLLPSSATILARVRGENPASEATTMEWMMCGKWAAIVPKNREFPQVHPAQVSTDDQILGIASPFASPKGNSIAGKLESIGTGKGDLAKALKTWPRWRFSYWKRCPQHFQKEGREVEHNQQEGELLEECAHSLEELCAQQGSTLSCEQRQSLMPCSYAITQISRE